ncbi:hypothetical protein [Krasilnikovia sp. MM14-A1259]|uniref:hypothetical protein n=1 Tax=Krasilnikovia sp. MM14-A1259 TaxID=3373539 RepID=UPI0037F916BD
MHAQQGPNSGNGRGLEHVYWIGGGSGAGKSTTTRALAARYGARTYVTDELMTEHQKRTNAIESPYLAKFMAMDMDERWMTRTPAEMLDTFHWYHGEGFGLIIDDLRAVPRDVPTIAEGFRLLPNLVEPLLTVRSHAVWLLPTPEFRLAAFESRGSMWTIAGKTTDPERALDNLLTRDHMFTERVRREARELDLNVIEVDPSMSEEDLASAVAELFGW